MDNSKNKTLFEKKCLIPTDFEINSDVVVFGHFHNAIEGALRWNAAIKENKIQTLVPSDMCLFVEPDRWHITQVIEDNDRHDGVLLIWHESLYLDIETTTKRSAKLGSYLCDEIAIDIDRILNGYLNTEYIGRYGWGSPRTSEFIADKEFIQKYVTDDFLQNDIVLSYESKFLLPNCHCFFVSPREFLNYFIPAARKKLENLCATVQNIDNELRAIYQAESAKQAFEIINICDQKWGPAYKYFLDRCREHWKIGQKVQKVQKKKSAPDYRDWLRAKDSIFHKGNQLAILEHSMNQQLDSGEIGFCINEGIVCSWRGDDHMGAKIFFDSSGEIPRAKALFLFNQ